MFLLVYFQWLYLLELFVFACLLILSGLKVKNILIIEYIKMNLKPLKIKNQDNYNWNDIICLNDFDEDSLEVIKRESKIGVNIYYIKYSNLRPLYFVINRVIGYIEEIKGSSDKYLVVLSSSRNKNIFKVLDKIWESIDDQINPNIKIKDCDKFRFNSDIDLPLNTTIEFRSLVINVSCIIEKDN